MRYLFCRGTSPGAYILYFDIIMLRYKEVNSSSLNLNWEDRNLNGI